MKNRCAEKEEEGHTHTTKLAWELPENTANQQRHRSDNDNEPNTYRKNKATVISLFSCLDNDVIKHKRDFKQAI